MAAPDTIAELYTKELKNLYDAEQRILKALPMMIDAASHGALRDALETHRQQTERQVQRLEQVFKELGESPKGGKDRGMEGMLDDGVSLTKDDIAPPVLDAGIIAAAQRVEHYEMAGYGSVRTWAEQLGLEAQARLLQETLNEEKEANRALTELAMQRVNRDAMTTDREVDLSGRSAGVADQTRPRTAGGSAGLADWPQSTRGG
jgi:ferritin-like metal-binding protein YciE